MIKDFHSISLQSLRGLIYLFTFSFMALSCSPSPKNKSTYVQFGHLKADSGSLHGGVMIYGIEPQLKTATALKLRDGTSTLLNNGTWDFFALRWEGPTHLEGYVKCGHVKAELIGQPRNVIIDVNSENCKQPFFSPTDFRDSENFLNISFHTCRGLSQVTSGEDNCDSHKGVTKSYKLFMIPFQKDSPDSLPVTGDPLQSLCIEADDTSSRTTTDYKIPVGQGSFSPLSFGIVAFEESGCPLSGLHKKFLFKNGLNGGVSVTGSALVFKDTTLNSTAVYLDHFPDNVTPLALLQTNVVTAVNFPLALTPFFSGGQAPYTYFPKNGGTITVDGFYNGGKSGMEDVEIQDSLGQKVTLTLESLTPALQASFLGSMPSSPPWGFFRNGGPFTYVQSSGQLASASTANTPRFEFNPKGVIQGLLVEKGATNKSLYSENFENSVWTKTSLAEVIINMDASPTGTTSADKVMDNNSNGSNAGFITQTYSGSLFPQKDYVFSAFVKADTSSIVAIYFSEPGVDCSAQVFNLQTLANTHSNFCSPASTKSFGIRPFANGWVRLWVSLRTSLASTPTLSGRIYVAYNSTFGPEADISAQGAVYLFGAQMEEGRNPTSFIPTSSGFATRPAEILKLMTSSFPAINPMVGTFLLEWSNSELDPAAEVSLFSYDSSANDRHSLVRTTEHQIAATIKNKGVTSLLNSFITPVIPQTINKVSYSYSPVEFAWSLNNQTPVTLPGTLDLPGPLNFIHLGSNYNATNQLGGHIRKLTYWDEVLDPQVIKQITK